MNRRGVAASRLCASCCSGGGMRGHYRRPPLSDTPPQVRGKPFGPRSWRQSQSGGHDPHLRTTRSLIGCMAHLSFEDGAPEVHASTRRALPLSAERDHQSRAEWAPVVVRGSTVALTLAATSWSGGVCVSDWMVHRTLPVSAHRCLAVARWRHTRAGTAVCGGLLCRQVGSRRARAISR